jgi:tetratricopeptide (TPR) repeat protein
MAWGRVRRPLVSVNLVRPRRRGREFEPVSCVQDGFARRGSNRSAVVLAWCRAILYWAILCLTILPRPALAQRLSLPAGALDSAALQNPLQMIDFVFVDDRPRALVLFDELLQRAPDIQPAMVTQIRYLRAVAASEQDAIVRTYRALMDVRGGEFVQAYPRILLGAGEFSEALRLARATVPPPGSPPRPLLHEIEASVARLRDEPQRALEAARAMRRTPGYDRNYVAIGLELAALAKVTPPARRSAALAALVDTALAITPRGFRVDPVAVFSGYGEALQDGGHLELAARAWHRALALVDSTAGRVQDRGAIARDSVRVTRGRLLYVLGRYAEARPLLEAPSGRRDLREQYRKGWLAVTALKLGDTVTTRRLEAELAADTTHALRGATAIARATIAEALGDPRRAAGLVYAQRNAIDVRTMVAQWQLRQTLRDPRLVTWMHGR